MHKNCFCLLLFLSHILILSSFLWLVYPQYLGLLRVAITTIIAPNEARAWTESSLFDGINCRIQGKIRIKTLKSLSRKYPQIYRSFCSNLSVLSLANGSKSRSFSNYYGRRRLWSVRVVGLRWVEGVDVKCNSKPINHPNKIGRVTSAGNTL